MAYAGRSDVLARMGPAAGKVTPTSNPSEAEVDDMLAADAAEIDAIVAGHGYTTPLTGASAAALENLNADMTALKVTTALYPASEGPNAASALIAGLQARVTAYMTALLDGSSYILKLLEATTTNGAGEDRATSFWQEEPTYPTSGDIDYLRRYPAMGPEFYRGMKF